MTMTLIQTQTLGANAASVTFSSIPQTYKSLKLVCSARAGSATIARDIFISFNGATTGKSDRVLYGNGGSASSYSDADSYAGSAPDASATANVFGNVEVTIPNYAGSAAKVASVDSVTENNAATAVQQLGAIAWTGTAAITSIALTPTAGNSFLTNSTFTLYGLS